MTASDCIIWLGLRKSWSWIFFFFFGGLCLLANRYGMHLPMQKKQYKNSAKETVQGAYRYGMHQPIFITMQKEQYKNNAKETVQNLPCKRNSTRTMQKKQYKILDASYCSAPCLSASSTDTRTPKRTVRFATLTSARRAAESLTSARRRRFVLSCEPPQQARTAGGRHNHLVHRTVAALVHSRKPTRAERLSLNSVLLVHISRELANVLGRALLHILKLRDLEQSKIWSNSVSRGPMGDPCTVDMESLFYLCGITYYSKQDLRTLVGGTPRFYWMVPLSFYKYCASSIIWKYKIYLIILSI